MTSRAAAHAQPTCSRSRRKPIAAAVAPAAPRRTPYPSVGFAPAAEAAYPRAGRRRSLGPQHRHEAGEHRSEHHQGRDSGRLADVGVAQPDAEHRQAQRHRDRPEAKTRCECCGADAERRNRHNREHRDTGQQAAEEHRHSDGRTEHDDRKPASAPGKQPGNRAGQHSKGERDAPLAIAQGNDRGGQRVHGAQCGGRPVPHQVRRMIGA